MKAWCGKKEFLTCKCPVLGKGRVALPIAVLFKLRGCGPPSFPASFKEWRKGESISAIPRIMYLWRNGAIFFLLIRGPGRVWRLWGALQSTCWILWSLERAKVASRTSVCRNLHTPRTWPDPGDRITVQAPSSRTYSSGKAPWKFENHCSTIWICLSHLSSYCLPSTSAIPGDNCSHDRHLYKCKFSSLFLTEFIPSSTTSSRDWQRWTFVRFLNGKVSTNSIVITTLQKYHS